jgi:hypothetical protein
VFVEWRKACGDVCGSVIAIAINPRNDVLHVVCMKVIDNNRVDMSVMKLG